MNAIAYHVSEFEGKRRIRVASWDGYGDEWLEEMSLPVDVARYQAKPHHWRRCKGQLWNYDSIDPRLVVGKNVWIWSGRVSTYVNTRPETEPLRVFWNPEKRRRDWVEDDFKELAHMLATRQKSCVLHYPLVEMHGFAYSHVIHGGMRRIDWAKHVPSQEIDLGGSLE